MYLLPGIQLLIFLDFADFPILNSEFGDLEHLNYRGAAKFSIWFNKLIESGLLQEPNKQLLINKNSTSEISTNV
jgi:hypothetical protein